VSDRDKGGYYHENFLRGEEELALKIQRTKIKGTGPRKPHCMESPTPNFYDMPYLPEFKQQKSETPAKTATPSNHSNDVITAKESTRTEKETTAKKSQNVVDDLPRGGRVSCSRTVRPNENEDEEGTARAVLWLQRNQQEQEQLQQLQLLNQIERDSLLLSSCRKSINLSSSSMIPTDHHPLSLLSRFGYPTASGGLPLKVGTAMLPAQSLLGLTYPYGITLSSSIMPPASSFSSSLYQPSIVTSRGGVPMTTPSSSLNSNPSETIRTALAKYFQQQQPKSTAT
jgi:hypothetical protein